MGHSASLALAKHLDAACTAAELFGFALGWEP